MTTIRYTVVEVHAMSDFLTRSSVYGSREMVPWGDPYIAALMGKLRHAQALAEPGKKLRLLRAEAPPPLAEPLTAPLPAGTRDGHRMRGYAPDFDWN